MPPAVADPESGERVVKELPALMDGSAADTDTPDTSQQQQEAHKPKHVVGIIYPPPEVRNIVDKTASFVARNGPEFESRIRQNELNNPKFNFLNGGDPYHAYYQHRVEEIREGRAEPVTGSLKPLVPLQLTPQSAPGGGAAAGGGTIAAGAPGSQVRAGQEMFRPAAEKQLIVTEPPPPYEFTADPPSISSVDLDIVKLTAQFVARNGRQFLTHLMNREQRNYQFDFLRPQHSLFQYFTKLLEQYTKVLIPPKDLMAKLDLEAESPAQVLDRVRYRVEWDRVQEARKRREEEAVERERVSYAQIDWHDFVVVETVDYQPWEQGQFPPPTTPAQVGQRVLMQERIDDGEEMQMSDEEPEPEPEPEESSSSSSEEEEDEEEEEDRPAAGRRGEQERGVQDNTQVQDMEEDSDDETEEPRRQAPPPPSLSGRMQPPPPPMPPKPDQVVIKKYDPKAAAKPSRAPAPDEYLISPITGERIPASKVAEHMRIGLLDPRWVEQRDRQLNEKVNQETVFATGGDIGSHLQNLAERRTDIFGAGDEETIIGKKIGEEEKRADDKSIWDGHSSSVDATRSAARASITLDQQISHIHKAKGLMEESERIGPKKAGGRGADRRDRERERERERREREEQRDRQPPPPPPLPPTPREAPKPPPPPPASAPAPPPPPPPPPREVPKPPPPAPPAPRLTPAQPPAPPQPLLLRPQMMATPMGPQGVMLAPRPPVVMPARPMFMQPMPAGFMPQMQPGPPRPPMPVRPQMPMAPEPMVPGGDDEPPNKRARTEDSLVPEQLWLARHPQGSVTFCVSVPIVTDKPEWRLSGQTLSLTMPLTELVSVLKGRLSDETGLPPGKQKLLGEGFFFKDSNSLAYYNVANGSTVQLQLKERGGRKK